MTSTILQAGARPRALRVSPAVRRELALVPVIIAALIVGTILSPTFLTANNLLNNVLVNSSVLGIVVVAESVILISGYFDLSLESIVGLAPMVAVWLVLPSSLGGSGLGIPSWLAIVACFAVSAIIGATNGLLVTKLKLNAFIVTLAMLTLLRGVTTGISGGQTLSRLPAEFLFLGSARPFGISIQIWIFVVVVIVVSAFMQNHPVGRKVYALGGNQAAAASAGIKTTKLTIAVFVFGALLSALAGLMLTGRIASVTSDQGNGLIFTVFAAAVIGGISLNGGQGTIFGAFCGVLLLGVIQNILTLSRVPSYWIAAIYGLVILCALIFNYLAGARPRRHTQRA